MSKHSIKKYIKQKKKKTINKKYNKKKNMRKSYRNKSKKTRKTYKLKGGSGYTLTPSPIMNAWYNLMSYPSYLTNVLNGSNSPNYLNSDPTAGHVITSD